MKRGRLSADDKAKIKGMAAEGKTAAQIGKKLGRSEAFITKTLGAPPVEVPTEPTKVPMMPTAKDIMLTNGRKNGAVIMTEAASQIGDEAAKTSGQLPHFSDCIAKIDPSR